MQSCVAIESYSVPPNCKTGLAESSPSTVSGYPFDLRWDSEIFLVWRALAHVLNEHELDGIPSDSKAGITSGPGLLPFHACSLEEVKAATIHVLESIRNSLLLNYMPQQLEVEITWTRIRDFQCCACVMLLTAVNNVERGFDKHIPFV